MNFFVFKTISPEMKIQMEISVALGENLLEVPVNQGELIEA
jgi:hypothetical protein